MLTGNYISLYPFLGKNCGCFRADASQFSLFDNLPFLPQYSQQIIYRGSAGEGDYIDFASRKHLLGLRSRPGSSGGSICSYLVNFGSKVGEPIGNLVIGYISPGQKNFAPGNVLLFESGKEALAGIYLRNVIWMNTSFLEGASRSRADSSNLSISKPARIQLQRI